MIGKLWDYVRVWTLPLCLTLTIAAALLPGTVRAETIVTETITEDGSGLEITGTGGEMTAEDAAKWSAYKDTTNCTFIKIDGFTTIANNAFKDFDSLQTVTLPEELANIGEAAFSGCTGLSSITIPSNVTGIGNSAFMDCTSLSSITIPSSVTSIKYRAFRSCTNLTDVTISEGVTEIGGGASPGDGAFEGCSSLTSIVIPSTVSSIGGHAFSDCTNLEAVVFKGSAVSPGSRIFEADNNLSAIYYPYGDASWTDAAKSDVNSSATWTPFGTTTLTVSDIPAAEPLEVTVTSSDVPFKPDEAVKAENYVFDSSYHVVSASVSEDGMTVTLTLQKADSGIAAQAEGVGLTIDNGVLEAVDLDVATMTVVGSTSINVNIADPAAPTTSLEVIKVWNDDNSPARPGSIRVSLSNSQGIQGYASLSDANNWRHEWTGLDASETWTADEVGVPDGYSSNKTRDGNTVTIANTLVPSEPSTPSNPPKKSPHTSGGAYPRPQTPAKQEPQVLPFPEVVPPFADISSPIQDIVKEEDAINWGERIDPPQYALDLYDALSGGSGRPGLGSFTDFLVQDASYRLEPVSPGQSHGGYEVVEAEAITLALLEPYAAAPENPENEGLTSMIFENDAFFSVGVGEGDQHVNYGTLVLGDLVKTDTFSGIFVTKEPKDGGFDARKKEVTSYVATVFQAFDKDHPEVFWLNGKCKIRIMTVRDSGGASTAYFFFVLADKDGFTMKSPVWAPEGAVAEGLQRRSTAVERILSGVTGETPADKLKALNRILTETNEYNTTPDLTTIGNEPHECLSVLEGRIGTDGPVCDGYSRAMKVLCDQLEIPCVLETGYAKPTADSSGTFHMWNSIQVGGSWYGTDVTWNDPMVKGVSGAKSGKENEQYLLVGSATEIRGMAFSASHPTINTAAEGGVSFINGPTLSTTAFSALTPQSGLTALPFTDVPDGAWYGEAVEYVRQRGLMNGVTPTSFQPGGALTRQQMWMILARLSGQQPADMAAARQWALDSGVSDGTNPGAPVSRQQMVAFLYRLSGQNGGADRLAAFADWESVAAYAREALGWAVEKGVITGTSDTVLSPGAAATRAQFAVVLRRYCEAVGT